MRKRKEYSLLLSSENLFLASGMVGNTLFAIFNAVVAVTSLSAWLGSLAAYYALLGLLRMNTLRQALVIIGVTDETERQQRECMVFRKDSYLFVAMSVVLMVMDYLLEFSQGGSEYPGITIYVAALFTFYKLIRSILNLIHTRKEKSLLATSLRRMGYIDACVSTLILQTAMLSSFGNMREMYIIMLNGAVCSVVCIIVLGMGVHGICYSGEIKNKIGFGGIEK